MAKQIARLLRTDMMADMTLPALAQLLQKKGRGKDTILAHITPGEARRLKKDGGSGTINPDTGLFEFEDDGDFPVYNSSGEEMAPAEVGRANPDLYAGGELPAADQQTRFTPTVEAPAAEQTFQPTPALDYASQPSAQPQQPSYGQSQYSLGGMTPPLGLQVPTAADTSLQPGIKAGMLGEEAQPKPAEGMSAQTKDMLLKGALGLGTGLAGAYAGRKSAQQAQAAKGEMAAIGAPYQQKGQELQAAALRGELTPAGQQQVQAARAQLAQGIERRGGVGAAQAATQLAGFKQQLLDTQYNYGLKVAQIGDSYAANAIRLGLTQDKEMAALMGGLTSAAGAFIGGQPNVPKG